jgi:tetratricopeptide (TPR) repeat protein
MALAKVLLARNLFAEASRVGKEAVELRSRPSVSATDRASAMALLADILFEANDVEAAVPLNEQVIDLYRSQLGEQHPLIADRHTALGLQLVKLGRRQEGLEHNRRALEILQGWYGRGHPRTAAALTALAQAMVLMKRTEGKERYLVEAEPMLREALAIQERAHGRMHPAVAEAAYALGVLALHRARYDEAIDWFEQTEEIERTTRGELHTDYADSVLAQGTANLVGGNFARAEKLYRRAFKIYEAAARASGNTSPGDGTGAFYMGAALLGQKKFKEAEAASLTAYELFKKRGVFMSGLVPDVRANLAAIYDGLGEPEKAARFRAELEAATARQTATSGTRR